MALPNGQSFSLQPKHEWKKRVKQGDIITLSYDNISSLGMPIGAKIQRIRKDITWEQILQGNKETNQTLTGVTNLALHAQNTRGHWTSNDRENIINFFDEFAREKGLNPRNPNSWYNVTQQDITLVPNGNSMLSHYGGSVVKALLDIYPDIGIEISNFSTMPKRFWQERTNLLNFFNKYAETKGFDPLVASHWYKISKESIKSHKGGESVLKACKGSYIKILISLYPNIGLRENQFSARSKRDYVVEMT